MILLFPEYDYLYIYHYHYCLYDLLLFIYYIILLCHIYYCILSLLCIVYISYNINVSYILSYIIMMYCCLYII